MPIPVFNSNSVLPPHLGDPRQIGELSPYPCTAGELCGQFATSPERVGILNGFLRLRADLRRHGMTDGFQWIGGSFLEEVERTETRPPGDIDVVTFYWSANPDFNTKLVAAFPEIMDEARIKALYRVHHFPIDAAYLPETTIELTRYWCGLFSHTRAEVWKGMLRVDLNTPGGDAAAANLLTSRP